jgi:hypothetical protein
VNVNFQGTSFVPNGLLMPRSTYYPIPHRGPQGLLRFDNPSQRLLMTEKDGDLQYGGPIGLSPAGTFHYQNVVNQVRPVTAAAARTGDWQTCCSSTAGSPPWTTARSSARRRKR